MKLQLNSEHFNYYSNDSDIKALDSLSKELEASYTKITGDFKVNFSEKVRVYIYPDVTSFHKAIGHPEYPDWVVGTGGDNELGMVSPLNPGSAHTYQDLMKTVVHEFVHVVTRKVASGLGTKSKWLWEGLATYESKQYSTAVKDYLRTDISANNIPTLSEMEKAGNVGFGNIKGYEFSYTIIDFMVNKYGMDKIIELVKSPDNYMGIFGISKDDFEKAWIQYLKD